MEYNLASEKFPSVRILLLLNRSLGHILPSLGLLLYLWMWLSFNCLFQVHLLEMTSHERVEMSPQYNKAPYTIVEIKATLPPPELRAYQTCPTWTHWLQSVASHPAVDTSWQGDTKTSHTLSALPEHSLYCGSLRLSWTNYVRVKIIRMISEPQIPFLKTSHFLNLQENFLLYFLFFTLYPFFKPYVMSMCLGSLCELWVGKLCVVMSARLDLQRLLLSAEGWDWIRALVLHLSV